MYRTQLMMTCILVVVFGLSACGQSGTSANQPNQAGQQFLNDRGATAGPAAANPGGMPVGQSVVGTVEQFDGNKLIVKNPLDGTSVTVQIGSDTKVKKQAPGVLSDIKVGDQVTAFGIRNGNSFDPQIINIGLIVGVTTFGGGGGGGLPGGQDTGNMAVPAPNAPGNGPVGGPSGGPEPLAGTIEKVDGNKVTVKSTEGQSFIMEVTDKVKISKQMDAKVDEIQAGVNIMADVSKNGQVIQATQVQIFPDAPQP